MSSATPLVGSRRKRVGAGLLSAASLMGLVLAGSAQAATPPVGLGSAYSFSVLAGSTITNTGPTTMFGEMGLNPGTSITGAPHALGATHINDGVSLQAKSSLVTGYNDAAGRPSTHLASADLSGQTFTPGVYSASSSLLFSAGRMTLNAQGDPNAVFIFQVGSSLTTGSATSVQLTNGAQPCNVYWKIGASATLGTNSRFIGTVMALTTITANTGMTMNGRLLARNGAVNMDTNTITTSACAAGTKGGGTPGTPTIPGTPGTPPVTPPTTKATPPGSKTTSTPKKRAAAKRKAAAKKKAAAKRKAAKKRAAKKRALAKKRAAALRARIRLTRAGRTRPPRTSHRSPSRPPHTRGGFTG